MSICDFCSEKCPIKYANSVMSICCISCFWKAEDEYFLPKNDDLLIEVNGEQLTIKKAKTLFGSKLKTIEQFKERITETICGSIEKTEEWLATPNNAFNDKIPKEMIEKGDTEPIMQMIIGVEDGTFL